MLPISWSSPSPGTLAYPKSWTSGSSSRTRHGIEEKGLRLRKKGLGGNRLRRGRGEILGRSLLDIMWLRRREAALHLPIHGTNLSTLFRSISAASTVLSSGSSRSCAPQKFKWRSLVLCFALLSPPSLRSFFPMFTWVVEEKGKFIFSKKKEK